jgi:hypothetical protein
MAGLGGFSAFLLLAHLGTMREVVLLRGDVKVFRDLIQHPPAPSFVNGRLPDELVNKLSERDATMPGRHQVVAFLSPGCRPCEQLGEDLSTAVANGDLERDDVFVVAWAFATDEAERFAARLGLPYLVDVNGDLARACEIRGTPTLFVVERDTHKVLDFSPEGSAAWVLDRMNTDRQLAVYLHA